MILLTRTSRRRRWWCWWRWRWRRLKFVVFINSNRNIPSATETFRDDDKISCTKLYKLWWWTFWVCPHFPFQQITCFLCIKLQLVLPRRATPSIIIYPKTKQQKYPLNLNHYGIWTDTKNNREKETLLGPTLDVKLWEFWLWRVSFYNNSKVIISHE